MDEEEEDNQMSMMDRVMNRGKLWEEVDKKLQEVMVCKLQV